MAILIFTSYTTTLYVNKNAYIHGNASRPNDR